MGKQTKPIVRPARRTSIHAVKERPAKNVRTASMANRWKRKAFALASAGSANFQVFHRSVRLGFHGRGDMPCPPLELVPSLAPVSIIASIGSFNRAPCTWI
jgi:hypothetical protein